MCPRSVFRDEEACGSGGPHHQVGSSLIVPFYLCFMVLSHSVVSSCLSLSYSHSQGHLHTCALLYLHIFSFFSFQIMNLKSSKLHTGNIFSHILKLETCTDF